METSAKNATNVEQAFMAMAGDIKNRYLLLPVKYSLFILKKRYHLVHSFSFVSPFTLGWQVSRR